MPRARKSILSPDQSLLQRLQAQLQLNQSYVGLILGLLIILVGGVLVFNYFKQNQASLGPAEQTTESEQKDVEPEDLPGKYTVKEGDTLFDIAQKYYNDGYQFTVIAQANKLENADVIDVGQVLDIPKVEILQGEGTGGAVNQTIWGEKIEGDTYTVAEDDWLSKIAGRAYGDIMAYDKIAQANNISNPDLIEVGQVLKIPR